MEGGASNWRQYLFQGETLVNINRFLFSLWNSLINETFLCEEYFCPLIFAAGAEKAETSSSARARPMWAFPS